MARRLVACALGLCLVAACGSEAAARVDGEEISMETLRHELETMAANTAYISYLQRKTSKRLVEGGLVPELVAEVLTVLITTEVLDDEVERRKIDITDDDRRGGAIEASANAGAPSIFGRFPAWYRKETARRGAVRAALRRSLVANVTPRSYYENHQADFVRPCTRHILVATRGDADEAVARVRAGEPFAEVAKDVSLDEGTRAKGGDLGCNARGHLVAPLDKAALEQRIGRVGPATRTSDGYHILLVERRGIPPLAQIAGRVAGAITRLSYERLDELARVRLKAADVTVSDRIGRWNGAQVEAS